MGENMNLQLGKTANSSRTVLVYGDSTSAVLAIQSLLRANTLESQKEDQNAHEIKIVWAAGSGAHVLPVMPSLQAPLAAQVLQNSINPETRYLFEMVSGNHHRLYKNKSFKPEAGELWEPEAMFVGQAEFQLLGLSMVQIEESLRNEILLDSRVTRVEAAPMIEFEIFPEGGKVQLANHTVVEFDQFIYCDSAQHLRNYPKVAALLKHQVGHFKPSQLASVLQVVFHHSAPLNQKITAGLLIPMTKESGESMERHALGYFLDDSRSVWTVIMQGHEAEENHDVMKKLRKLKQALNKVFEGPEFLPEGMENFMSTVSKEQVRFELNYFAHGVETRFQKSDFILATDAFGLTQSLEALGKWLEVPVEDEALELAHSLSSSARAVSPEASL